MSGLHYCHKLPWAKLVNFYREYKHPPIKLPVGKCNKIHIVNNRVKNQLKNRTYLHDRICSDSECKVIVKEAEFRKSEKLLNSFFISRNKRYEPHSVKEYFFKRFVEAVFDYINTMKKSNDDLIEKGYPRDYEQDNLTLCDRCNTFIMLIETKNLPALEKYDNQQLKDIFHCSHGTQAVGRNMSFLFYHVLCVYFLTNFIFATNNIKNISNWYKMKPNEYFRISLMCACDGQTFLPTCRKYLLNEVYMKNLDATKELCKKCFEFICIYTMLQLKIMPPDSLELYNYYDLYFL